ncbi:hypothetical protein R6Z07F_015024 [Ovis aries]
MAPAASKLRAEAGLGPLPRRALSQYLRLLRLYPVLTKAATSGILSALGNFLAQLIEKKQKKENCSQKLDVSGPLRYAIYGFFFTGPLGHFFYLLMERWIPSDVPLAGIKRLLLDRLLFAPAFLSLFFLVMNFLEGQDTAAFTAKMKSGFWPALRMNWRVWTPVQFININYIPVQFRVLFANLVALFWQKRLAQQAFGSRSTKGLRTTAYPPAPPLSPEVTAANAAAPAKPAGRKRTPNEACPSPHAVHTRARLRGARVGSTRDLTGMAFRQALQLAACGLAGGSAAVLFSAVAVGKPRAGGDAEPRVVEPAAWAGAARPGPGVWDPNWDRREPLSLVNLRKRNLESGEEELTSRLDHCKAKATRHIFLIRHSQYHVDASLEKDRTLTPLGREQAELTGLRLASLGLKFNKIVHSSMTRAVETTDIISKHLPGVCKVSTDLLREGAPIEPDPPVSHWKPEAVQYYEDGARIEAAFRNYIHRADAKQQEDSYEIFICHANVIRYIVCRALQFPPEGWLRLSLNNGSITHLVVRPDGRVALRALGDTGFMPPDKISRS